MIQAFKIVNHLNEELYLEIRKPEATGFLVASVTGLGYPKVNFSEQKCANDDGSYYGEQHIEQRNIVMNIVFYNNNVEKLDIESLRWKLQRFLIVKSELKFYVINEHGTFWIKGFVETNDVNIFSSQEGAQISILCPDPFWISNEGSKLVTVGLSEPSFEFPVEFKSKPIDENSKYEIVPNTEGGYDAHADVLLYDFEENSGTKNLQIGNTTVTVKYSGFKAVPKYEAKTVEFGKIKSYPSTEIDYKGSAVTGIQIIIEARDEITGFRIDNATRKEYIIIDETKLKPDIGHIRNHDQIIINTSRGEKSAILVRDGFSYNILNACSTMRKWIKFQTGLNVLSYSTTSDIRTADVKVVYLTKYLGV